MDFSLSKSAVSNILSVCDSNITQSIDSDITLPEYVADIETVLSCTLNPETESLMLNDGRITVEGHALIKLLYTSPDCAVHCFESSVPFSRFADAQNVLQTDCISVEACTQYVNCRLVNPRRFDVHGSVAVSVRASRAVGVDIVSQAVGAGLQTDIKSLEVSNACAVTEKPFSLNEVLELNAELPSVAQMVSLTASPCINETKLISGKALVKGEMTVQALYVADGTKDMIQSTQFILPISQIIELETNEECDIAISSATVTAVDCTVRADSSGKIRLLDISVFARARVSVLKTVEIQYIRDAYSTEYDIGIETKRIETRCLAEQFTDSCLCRGGFSATGKDIANVISLTTRDIISSVSRRDGKLIISGSVRAGLTVEYSNGEKGYIEKPLEFEYSRQTDCDEIVCEKSVRVNSSSFLITSQTNIDVRVEVEISAAIFTVRSITALTDISVNEECKKSRCGSALTLYYPDKRESVWEIAKKYNTTVLAIREENSITDEMPEPGTMLILPRM